MDSLTTIYQTSILDRLCEKISLEDQQRYKHLKHLRPIIEGNKCTLSTLKQCILKDLEELLNTRCYMNKDLSKIGYKEIDKQSLIQYGIKDYITLDMNSDRVVVSLINDIKQTIKKFEPRLTNIKVTQASIIEKGADKKNTPKINEINLKISANINHKIIQNEIMFDTILDLNQGRYTISI